MTMEVGTVYELGRILVFCLHATPPPTPPTTTGRELTT